MTEAERKELEALNAYWPKHPERDMSEDTYRRWTDLQVMARDEARQEASCTYCGRTHDQEPFACGKGGCPLGGDL